MSCGCSQPAPGTVCRVRSGQDLSVRKAERYAMCAACPALSPSGVICTVEGRDAGAMVYDAACPLGRFPDRKGHVRWMGVVWIGVPMPARWRLWWLYGPPKEKLPGCGCVRVGKLYWRLAKRWVKSLSS